MKLSTLLPATLLALITGLSGCASMSGKSDNERVEQRATEQMNAFLAKDYPKALTYMTPGYQQTRQLYGFGADFACLVDMVDFTITGSQCQEDRCEVSVTRKQKMPGFVTGGDVNPDKFTFNASTKRVWVRTKGKWYHYK